VAVSVLSPEEPNKRRGPYGLAGRLPSGKPVLRTGPELTPGSADPAAVPGIMALGVSLDSFGRTDTAERTQEPSPAPNTRRPSGRKVSPIPPDTEPALAALVEYMRGLRIHSGMTLKKLSGQCNYSEAALSTAASGKSVPNWEIVAAFTEGCGASASEMREVRRLWIEADRNRPGNGGIRPVSNDGSGGGGGSRRRHRYRAEQPTAQLGTLVALVREAVQEEDRAEFKSPDPLRTALSLCTTPDDFVALLKHLMDDKQLRPKEIPALAARHGLQIGKPDLDAVFDQTRLPATETLHAFLVACGIETEQTLLWHHHAARLKIAQIRGADAPPPIHGLGAALRQHYHRPTTMILMGMLTAFVQVVVVLYPHWGK
jgi:hypothetical protein